MDPSSREASVEAIFSSETYNGEIQFSPETLPAQDIHRQPRDYESAWAGVGSFWKPWAIHATKGTALLNLKWRDGTLGPNVTLAWPM